MWEQAPKSIKWNNVCDFSKTQMWPKWVLQAWGSRGSSLPHGWPSSVRLTRTSLSASHWLCPSAITSAEWLKTKWNRTRRLVSLENSSGQVKDNILANGKNAVFCCFKRKWTEIWLFSQSRDHEKPLQTLLHWNVKLCQVSEHNFQMPKVCVRLSSCDMNVNYTLWALSRGGPFIPQWVEKHMENNGGRCKRANFLFSMVGSQLF